ncbi:hypothetical protein FHR90_002393 [Endobacter medicaginis]|uniref:Uncharacterized protein n=1 Tax=Endobacter medicaginis TaxID=1181271 RepID=A0A839UW80_9PROT|nr:hypothetical protein [Endobacter medicaginis]MBB3174548.1 hypothetical protein [Endobacter medicaginis]MCX5474759.1 hypothetical protein [Endobacter medicaginis]NVN29181.1 hypothetical protein [Endobacter medicaginis]
MIDKTAIKAIQHYITISGDAAYTLQELRDIAGADAKPAIDTLIRRQVLGRLGQGLYVPMKPGVFRPGPVPAFAFEQSCACVLRKMGIEFRPGRAIRDYNAGRSTQVPARVIFEVRGIRMPQMQFGKQVLLYDNKMYSKAKLQRFAAVDPWPCDGELSADQATQRLRDYMRAVPDSIYLRADFERLAATQTSAAIRAITAANLVAEIGNGIYARLESSADGYQLAAGGLYRTAARALDRLDIEWRPGLAWRRYQSGVGPKPPVPCFEVRGRRRPRLQYAGVAVEYDNEGMTAAELRVVGREDPWPGNGWPAR